MERKEKPLGFCKRLINFLTKNLSRYDTDRKVTLGCAIERGKSKRVTVPVNGTLSDDAKDMKKHRFDEEDEVQPVPPINMSVNIPITDIVEDKNEEKLKKKKLVRIISKGASRDNIHDKGIEEMLTKKIPPVSVKGDNKFENDLLDRIPSRDRKKVEGEATAVRPPANVPEGEVTMVKPPVKLPSRTGEGPQKI